MSKQHVKRSIFRSLFIPMILIMILQSLIFYIVAVYGGVEDSLNQNAKDILSERLYSRKSDVDTLFNNKWSQLGDCIRDINEQYSEYEREYGQLPMCNDEQRQIAFLGNSAETLIDSLRFCETNGIFLILNNNETKQSVVANDKKYGLCIRDMDQGSDYIGTEDLLLERGPSSLVDSIGCQLDSWWEARYCFDNAEAGDYFFEPLNAAWNAPKANGEDLSFISSTHQISGSDPKMISYSLPLVSAAGYPYAVLGVELSVNYLASLIPGRELTSGTERSCYIIAMKEGEGAYQTMAGSGAFFNRSFGEAYSIEPDDENESGDITITGRDGTKLYARCAQFETYNTNNPFSERRIMLMAVVENKAMFAYITQIKTTLLIVALFSLLLGVSGLTLVSRHFAAPITALARRVHDMDDETRLDYSLERLGITEIDQLVDSIDELNKNVSRDSARTEFFSRMSHDMRTPMNAIISFSSKELLENADEATKDDYLDKINISGTYLLGLINEVLDMTKIESKTTMLRTETVEAASLFDTTIPIIEKIAHEKGVIFSCNINIESGNYVTADKQHINQVLMNLLSNAVKFTESGESVKLDVDFVTADSVQNCNIVVTDTGVGMSEEFMQKLYTPFAQEGVNHEGTGLGLSIARKLVLLMGGEIACSSTKNVGTVFRVSIPLQAALGEVANDVPELCDITGLKGKRVLVCEDNQINTLIIVNLLERVGIISDIAENGELGYDMFCNAQPETYSAILMDIRMPVMNGLDATKKIRASKSVQAQTIPIIAMTADAFAEDAEISIAAGMNEHLLKPIEPQKLYDALIRFML